MFDLKWSQAEKVIARRAFDMALQKELQATIHEAKRRAAKVEERGEQGAEMQRDVKGEFMSRGKLVPAQQPPHNNEVSRA